MFLSPLAPFSLDYGGYIISLKDEQMDSYHFFSFQNVLSIPILCLSVYILRIMFSIDTKYLSGVLILIKAVCQFGNEHIYVEVLQSMTMVCLPIYLDPSFGFCHQHYVQVPA